jgi:predicted alpha/beta hydrolase family esterase
MLPPALSGFRVLVVPGLHNSGPGHWQTRWQQLAPDFERVEQANWDVPMLHDWSLQLAQQLRRSARPTLIIAHSFGCLTTIHQARLDPGPIVGALLVAPADPAKFGVAEVLQDVLLPFPSIVVGSTNDPWMQARRAAQWAKRWGGEFVNAGAKGHINAESDLGDWGFGHELVRRLLRKVPHPLSNGRCICA